MKNLLGIAVLAALACAPASAHAQFFGRGGAYRPVYSGGYGYNSGYGYTGGYGYGGGSYNFGGVGVPYNSGAYHPIFDYMPPVTYTTTNIPLGNFGPSPITHSYIPGASYAPSNNYGYTANPGDPAPRKRPSLYPALPVRETPREPIPETNPAEPIPKPAALDPTRASIQIQVPQADAKLFFDGELTKQAGVLRVFNTPPLETGFDYSFRVRVTWTDALDQPQEKAWTVRVRAGDALRDSFKDH